MKPINTLDRRQFVKLGALAATAAAVAPGAARAQAAGNAKYSLADLPYAFDALEPYIDAQTMEIHHGKHHAAYVNNLNKALEELGDSAPDSLDGLMRELPSIDNESIRTTIRNNGGGHWNHDFFWNSMAPAAKSGATSPELAAAIAAEFGSLDVFRSTFADAATGRFGSGWAWLIVRDGELKVVSTPNQDNPLMRGIVPDSDLGTPLLGLDVWEHAYYLKYQNRRGEYIGQWWEIVNWPVVSERFANADVS